MGYKKIKLSLNTQLILSLVLIIIFLVLSIVISINNIFVKKFDQYIVDANKAEIVTLIESIESSYKNGTWNKGDIDQIGKLAITKCLFIDLYDKNNNLIWGAKTYNDDLCYQILSDIKDNMITVIPSWSGEYTESNYDLNDNNGDKIGYLKVGSYDSPYYLDAEINFLKDINKVIIIIGILMTIIAIIIGVIIAKKISKSLETLSCMAKKMGHGGYKQKLKYNSNIIEIDNLINSINDLSYKLDEQENLRKRLTTDISHELLTPLTSIQTHLEAMIDGIWEANTERLSSVIEEVIRLTNLVNQLRNLSKFDSDKNKLNLSKVNLANLLKNIIYNNQGNAFEKNINIGFEVEDISVYLDKDKMSQVIVNLLSNAIRYTPSNGNIHIQGYKKGDTIKIHFKDDGIGILEKDLKYIFERFYRVDESRSKNTGGIGVGLTIVKSIVDLHDGSIEVKSKINNGSEFIITLPNLENKVNHL